MMEQDEKRIRETSYKHRDGKIQTLMHHVNASNLYQAHWHQMKNKATGVDNVSKDEYEINIVDNVQDLLTRMRNFSYHPKPTRRKYIPKINGKLRPLGIVSYEDKLVQKVMYDILVNVYEPRFLSTSYGFRPELSCHDAIRDINSTIRNNNINWIVEADIKGFFDNLSHDWLMKFLENDIEDKNFLRYIKRFLVAGVMDEGKFFKTDKGAIQGGNLSPVLANVYLHYVLDLWFDKIVKPNLKGKAFIQRYADDFICEFENQEDAESFYRVLPKRLGKFGLDVAEEKTRIFPFGRHSHSKEIFDFLGFTFINGKSRKGYYKVVIITSSKKLKAKRIVVKAWIKSQMHRPVVEIINKLNKKLVGHYRYYGLNGNFYKMNEFRNFCIKRLFRVLRKRGQKHKINWEKFQRIMKFSPVASPKIYVQIW
jgi:group II intron reverse transcriptase/maturase